MRMLAKTLKTIQIISPWLNQRKRQCLDRKILAHTHKTLAGNRIIRNFTIFVGGISNEVTGEDLTEYIMDEINITPISIKVHKINDYNRSYKVTIQKKDKDKVFCPTNWEENIIIKLFRERKPFDEEYSKWNWN